MSHCEQCTDNPWLNISAEQPDSDRSIAIKHFVDRPPLGWDYNSTGCLRICVSEISQDEADDCALLQAQLCTFSERQPPPSNVDEPFQPASLFVNDTQTCTILCSNGQPTSLTGEGTFSWTIQAGAVLAFSQAEANTLANSLACARARQHRICISRALAGGCINEAYRQQIRASGGTPATWPFINFIPPLGCSADVAAGDRTSFSPIPYTWSLVGGALPPGLELRPCTGYIKGTPTTAGSYSFTVRATDSIGSFQQQTLILNIIEITTATPLSSAVLGEEYSQPLVQTGGDPLTETWELVSGSLPPGLNLSAAGIISGTPTGPLASYQFTVKVTTNP